MFHNQHIWQLKYIWCSTKHTFYSGKEEEIMIFLKNAVCSFTIFFSLRELVLFFKGTFYTYLVVIHEHKTIQELYVIKCMRNFEVRMLGHIPRFGSLCHKWGSAWVPSNWKFHRNHWLSSRKLKKIIKIAWISNFFPLSLDVLNMIYKYIVQKSMIGIHVSIFIVICSLWQEANFIRLNYRIYIYTHLFLK